MKDRIDRICFCRICKKPVVRSTLFMHAHRAHPIDLRNYLNSRLEFGISELEHFAVRVLPKAVIRR